VIPRQAGFPHLLESPRKCWIFFLEKSRTWKVLENHFGPGKSWKLKLKVLESPGKKPFLAGAPPRTPLGELTMLPQTS